jgi:hypothetical protein
MIISLEELAREKVKLRQPMNATCPMKDCRHIGDYERCYLHTYCNCEIYYLKYQLLSKEQRAML